MKYAVTVAGRTLEIDVTPGAVAIEGRPVEASLHPVPHTPLHQLVVKGTTRTVGLSRGRDGWIVQADGERWEVEVLDESTRTIRRLAGGATERRGDGVVSAPMPGLVLRVEVEVGQSVRKGMGLVVLEAMKMENEIRAMADGEVVKVLVQAGEAVERGAALVEIGPPR